MKVKYVHISNPDVEKMYDTKVAYQRNDLIRYGYPTQKEFDEAELKRFERDKNVNKTVLSYEVVEE